MKCNTSNIRVSGQNKSLVSLISAKLPYDCCSVNPTTFGRNLKKRERESQIMYFIMSRKKLEKIYRAIKREAATYEFLTTSDL